MGDLTTLLLGLNGKEGEIAGLRREIGVVGELRFE